LSAVPSGLCSDVPADASVSITPANRSAKRASAVSSGLRSDRYQAAVGLCQRERGVPGLAAADAIDGPAYREIRP
jgi:hypothetical protein